MCLNHWADRGEIVAFDGLVVCFYRVRFLRAPSWTRGVPAKCVRRISRLLEAKLQPRQNDTHCDRLSIVAALWGAKGGLGWSHAFDHGMFSMIRFVELGLINLCISALRDHSL